MSEIGHYIELMHDGHEYEDILPDNSLLVGIFGDQLLKTMSRELTPEEREGFLSMWRWHFVKQAIGGLTDEGLTLLQQRAVEETERENSEQRALDIRFIYSAVLSEISARTYQKPSEAVD